MRWVVHLSEFYLFVEYFSGGAIERWDTDEEFVGDAAKCSPINGLPMSHLEDYLRSEVLWGATYCLCLEFSLDVSSGESEVGYADIAFFINENIFWFKTKKHDQINHKNKLPINYILAVQVLEDQNHLRQIKPNPK